MAAGLLEGKSTEDRVEASDRRAHQNPPFERSDPEEKQQRHEQAQTKAMGRNAAIP